MKKIAVITTGGTIGSILMSDVVSVEPSQKRILREIKKAQNQLEYDIDVFQAVNKNSEDFDPLDWLKILKELSSVDSRKYDGIVVTHGTDTLVYSISSVLSFSYLWNKKICFTGAYYSPDDPLSDASLNLLAALEFSVAPHPATGVYLAFRSNPRSSEAHIINGIDVKPMWFDNQHFEATYNEIVATFTPNCGLVSDASFSFSKSPNLNGCHLPKEEKISEAMSRIAMLTVFPGMSFKDFKKSRFGKDILIFQMYHSGTCPSTSDTNKRFLKEVEELSSETLVLMGAFPERHIVNPYKSTKEIVNRGFHIYKDLQPHFLYTFSILGIAAGLEPNEIVHLLKRWEIENVSANWVKESI